MLITAFIATSIASIASAVSSAGTVATVASVAAGATASGAAAAGAATAMAAAKGMGAMALKNVAKEAAKGVASGVASGTMKELVGSDDSEDAENNVSSYIGTGVDLINHGTVYTCAKKCSEYATRKVLK